MHYTLVHRLVATNKSQSAMTSALAAELTNADLETLLDITISSDTATTSGTNGCVRTTVYHSGGTGPIPDGQPLADVLQGIYASTWSMDLGTPVEALPVTVSA